MKLTTFLLCVLLVQASAASKAQISLNLKNESMRQVLNDLSRQSGYDFIYADQDLELAKPISVRFNKVSLEKALEICFMGQPLVYQIADRTVMIKRKAEKSIVEKIIGYFQDIEVRGKVVGENNEPLAGATVTVKGTNRVVSTNEKGEFTFTKVAEKAILLISYMGYEPKEVIAKANLGEIKLVMVTGKLDEVAVVNTGYQKIDQRISSGAIDKVDLKRTQDIYGSNIFQKLKGNSPILFDNAEDKRSMTIRGLSSINNSSLPLIVLDNFPYAGNPEWINPEDIESITFLKDAAASAIWGSRAGNGVIVITTKRENTI